MKKKLFFLVFIFFLSSSIFAQLEDRLGFLTDQEVQDYVQPLATTLGVAFNSGSYHTAAVSKVFGFGLSFKYMMIFIPDDQKSFTPANMPEGYTASEPTATIYGGSGTAYPGPAGYLAYPSGLDISTMPMISPQISASLLGSELMLRYLPEISVGDENFSLFGFGLKHSISQYIPLAPVDIAVQFLYNTFTVTNIVDVSNIAFNAHASKTFGLFTAYGGLQYEATSVDFEYTFSDPNNTNPLLDGEKIKVSVDGENSFRFTVGAMLKLAVIALNVDYSLGSQGVFTTGLNFEF
jgi:hypothetical protein